jgi:vacuolar-type H+-ATPase subunit F/Vma7
MTRTARAEKAAGDAIVLLGTDEDVLGFGLAGVAGEVCSTPREVRRALAAIDARSVQPALLLVSSAVEQIAPQEFADRWMRVNGPVVVVLP